MIDKVQKIREGIEKRYEYWKEKEFNSHSIESEIRMSECKHLLLMLDSLQEEPKIPQVFDEGYWERLGEEPVSDDSKNHISLVTERMLKEGPIPTLRGKEKADFENEFNRFKQITGMINWPSREEIYKNVILWFIAWGKEHLKIGDIVDKSEIDEQPVSKDLETAANEWDAKASFTPFYMALDGNGNPYEIKQDYTTHAESFKAGAKWQKEKEYTCYEEAFEDGAKWQKEHMMVKAINAHCFGFQGAALFSFRLPADNYLVGSEVKVIVIKED